jgi:peptide/nickel transport system permease protein
LAWSPAHGTSLLYRQPVRNLVLKRIPISIFLAVYTMALAADVHTGFLNRAATNKGKWIDQAIPDRISVFHHYARLLAGHSADSAFEPQAAPVPTVILWTNLSDHLRYLFLPALTLALQLAGVLIRNLRSQIIQSMEADYVRTAHAKGLTESLVLWRHVLQNAIMPTVTIFGLQFGYLVGGTVVVETVFAVPGMGQLLIQSITGRDYPTVQAITIISATLVIVVNLLVDLSYSFLDPRVTYE